jgi:H+/gluconate symporter-like permease
MPSLDTSFWIGLALAVPLSVAANLLTPLLQRYISTRSEKQAKKQVDQLLKELSELDKLASDPLKLVVDLLREILIIIFLVAAAAVFYATTEWLSKVFPSIAILQNGPPLTLIIFSATIANFALDAAIRARNVRHIEKHREHIKRQLVKLGHDAA